MSAPHPKAQDDAPPPPAWLRPNGHVREPIAINLDTLANEISINRLDEIAKLIRALTWREMMDLSEAWNTPADILWKWSLEWPKNTTST